MTYEVVACSNMHIVSLAERADSIIKEVLLCESSGANEFFDADKTRIDSYNTELRDFVDWAATRPKLDLPKTHPRQQSIDYCAVDVSRHIQNRSLRDLVRLYEAVIKEMTESETANLSSGMGEHEKVRFEKIMDQVDALLNFMDSNQPLDKPESSPHAAEPLAGSLNSKPTH